MLFLRDINRPYLLNRFGSAAALFAVQPNRKGQINITFNFKCFYSQKSFQVKKNPQMSCLRCFCSGEKIRV